MRSSTSPCRRFHVRPGLHVEFGVPFHLEVAPVSSPKLAVSLDVLWDRDLGTISLLLGGDGGRVCSACGSAEYLSQTAHSSESLQAVKPHLLKVRLRRGGLNALLVTDFFTDHDVPQSVTEVDPQRGPGTYSKVPNRLHTIGYEGATLEDVLASVRKARVRLLIDIRAVAVSRRRGFSKKALTGALLNQGIEYLHLRDLGDPKPGREAARAGRHAEFLRIYRDHLSGDDAQAALRKAAVAASAKTSCLLCYEAEPSGCHRAVVARAISEATGLVVDHLHPGEQAG